MSAKTLALGLAVLAVAPAGATAAKHPTVDVFVVGRSRPADVGHQSVVARTVKVRASGRFCTAPSGTALSALEALRRAGGPSFAVTQQGGCSGLYVSRIGADKARGKSGWVYKVGRRAGTVGAADPSGPFGTGRRLRSRQQVLWFWCTLTATGGCQRTLEARPSTRTATTGESVTVTVKGYDDNGRGRAVAGVTVSLGTATATTDADGRATIVMPGGNGPALLRAAKPGTVDAFPSIVDRR